MKSEAAEQAALFEWAAYIPDLKWMYAIPNGGSRHPAEAAHLKAQGVKSGVSDIMLPVARGKYHGLFIEMKVGRNKPTENQKAFIEWVRMQGYCAVVCYGFEEAKNTITYYLKCNDLKK